MKKIFTLALGVLMTAALFAADRRPTVILNSSRNFEVVIDGRSYNNNGRTISLNHLNGGRHTIKVYEVRRGYFGARKRLVSQSSFQLRGNDLKIRIDNGGVIMFKESRNFGRNDRTRDRDFNDDQYGWKRGMNDRDFGDGRDDRNDRNDRNDRDNRNGQF